MSTSETTHAAPAALAGEAIERDARHLLGQVMGFVAVTVGFAALGAYICRDLSGGTGLLLFIPACACIFGLNIAAAKGREQLAIGFLFGQGGAARRPGLALDIRGFGAPQYQFLAFPAEEPPSIECNEDAGQELIDN